MADLFIGPDAADDAEVAAVAAVIGDDPAVVAETERLVRGGVRRRHERRHLLLPALHALHHAKGWISPGGLNHVCDVLQVPPAEAYGVATFYELFRTEDPGHRDDVHHVCVDPVCAVAGGDALAADLEADGVPVHRSPCLGQCERAPARFVQGVGRPDVVPAGRGRTGDEAPGGPAVAPSGAVIPQQGDPGLRLLARVGVVDPTSLDDHHAHGGGEALAHALRIGSAGICDLVAASGLTGRGGAAFPTGAKWRAVAAEHGRPKHVVANGDESEPGTFKDRIVMEHDPFALIEAMTIAGVATGAEQGWIYLRGEYPVAAERLGHAIAACRAAGLLGDGVMGSGHRFDIELRRGAGAYVCGEETALFASIEGFRGEPRSKPPYPTTHGLFGEPTAVNNPETLLNVPDIVRHGPDGYRRRGTEGSPGTKLLCLSGRVARPGLYEVDFGTPLGDVIDLAGGLAGSGRLRAVLLGGAAGSFVGPDALDLPLTLEDTRAAGATLGSGAVMVFTDDVDLLPVVTRIAAFFRDESCGQCVPCRIGTVRQHETLVHLGRTGTLAPDRRELLGDLGRVMADASICGLGHTAAAAVESALALGLIGADR
jgi:NADH-quinone oxidoreductase subunit F